MGKFSTRRVFFALAIFVFLSLNSSIGTVYAQSFVVAQPGGLQINVQQPAGFPANWFTTPDGFPVWRCPDDGVWRFGSFSNNTLIQTNHVVGSVSPGALGIAPVIPAMAVPMPTIQPMMPMPAPPLQAIPMPPAATMAPVPQPPAASVTMPQTIMVAPVPPLQAVPTAPFVIPQAVVATPVPAITNVVLDGFPLGLSIHFMDIWNLRANVDRIGILTRPVIPVAWRGTNPNVIFAWTGATWHELRVLRGQDPGDVLRQNQHTLTVLLRRSGARPWNTPQDISFLINNATVWGFAWMGNVNPTPMRIF